MNNHTLFIEMNSVPEALERVLRVTRHRGFIIKNMNMHHNGNSAQISVTVSSERPINHLTRQLNKLFDVIICQVQQEMSEKTIPALVANG